MEIESCVQCGEPTLYRITDHIDTRIGYVEGAGQLCIDCHRKLEESPRIDPDAVSCGLVG